MSMALLLFLWRITIGCTASSSDHTYGMMINRWSKIRSIDLSFLFEPSIHKVGSKLMKLTCYASFTPNNFKINLLPTV